jgi:TolA-binding protein
LFDSVQYLESQIADLEHEIERMSRAQEAQRAATSEVEAVTVKKMDDISKDVSKKVSWTTGLSQAQLILSCLGCGDRTAEAEVKAIC